MLTVDDARRLVSAIRGDTVDAVGCKTWLHYLHTTEAGIRKSAGELAEPARGIEPLTCGLQDSQGSSRLVAARRG